METLLEISGVDCDIISAILTDIRKTCDSIRRSTV
jgi:hypothetical protein